MRRNLSSQASERDIVRRKISQGTSYIYIINEIILSLDQDSIDEEENDEVGVDEKLYRRV